MLEAMAKKFRDEMVRVYRTAGADPAAVVKVRVLYEARKGRHRFDLRVTAKGGGYWSVCRELSAAETGDLDEAAAAEVCRLVEEEVLSIGREEVLCVAT